MRIFAQCSLNAGFTKPYNCRPTDCVILFGIIPVDWKWRGKKACGTAVMQRQENLERQAHWFTRWWTEHQYLSNLLYATSGDLMMQ